jgi:predicted permease
MSDRGPDWAQYVRQNLPLSGLRVEREAEVIEDLAEQLEEAYAEALHRGSSPSQAEAAAKRHINDWPALAKQLEHSPRGRESAMSGLQNRAEDRDIAKRGEFSLFTGLLQDLGYALRMLRKSPGFTAVAVLTMALGIGATTAIYSVIDATLLHPLPYPNPAELVRLEDDLPGVGARDVGISVPEWKDLERSGIFQFVSINGFSSVNLTGSAQPERISYKGVTPNYFAVLGVDAQLGRTFDPHDPTPGFNLEAVISDGLWRRDFAADPHILGKTLRLDDDDYHVVGVMPRRFRDAGMSSAERNTEVWLAVGLSGLPYPPPQRSLRLHRRVTARLRPGLSIAAAQGHLDALVASLKKEYPGDYPPQTEWTIRLIPLSESIIGSVRQSLILLFGAVALVLLISCVNVANLLLAKASGRGREIAVRQALGAPRTRLIRQLLTESLLLFLLGGIAGFAILFSARHFLMRVVPDSLPHLNDIAVGWGVLVFAVGISVVTGTIFGLAPAWLVSRVDLTGALRQESRGSKGSPGRSRARQILVISELALSLVLLVVAGLLLRSFWDLLKLQPGFHPERVMAVRTWLPGPNDPSLDRYRTATQEAPLVRELLRRGRTLPGVEDVAVGDLAALPLGHSHGDLSPMPIFREGVETKDNQTPVIDGSIVSPEYFDLLGMTLLRGRLFGDQDIEGTPEVAVINEAAARTYWPNEDALGKRVRLRSQNVGNRELLNPAKRDWTTIIGILADARTESLADAVLPQIYRSVYQHPEKGLIIFLRGQLDTSAIPAQVREQVQSVDPELPVFRAERLDDVVSASLSVRRFAMEMVAFFAATALLLAGLGIYGVVSYLVSERTREIGIRVALGAERRNVMSHVLGQGLRLAVSGAVVGLVGAFIASHLMAGLLYGVRPTDPLTFAGVAFLLIGVALLACYIPARRAMKVDPIVALRDE